MMKGIEPKVFCWDLLQDPDELNLPNVQRISHNGLLSENGTRKKAYFEWERIHSLSMSKSWKSP